ncbi:ATP-binding protein [Oricola sp.]|uniref:ATP-binding protein n=1 Tax=Oricola sp. TaxID=1979950 RepID=UPI0025F2559E|nr:ATP-binding protein [Oricola sp.]MCI5078684.1 ATP-binding protein [Oricola sp.]
MRPFDTRDHRSVIRIKRIAWILQVVSAVVLVALIALYVSISRTQDSLRSSVREDAIWAVYQLDRETRKLAIALERYVHSSDEIDTDLQELSLRYDILYSRLTILENSIYQDYFTKNSEVRLRIGEAKNEIRDFEPIFNAIAEGNEPSKELLEGVEDRFKELANATEDFLSFTNSTISTQRAENRNLMIRLGNVAAAIVVILVFSLLALILTMRRQVSSALAFAERSDEISRELSRSWEAAEAGNRAKSQFIATMSHEIRTPLNAILGMAELIDTEDLPRDTAECVHVIRASGHALLEMLTDILDYSKIEHGKLEIEYKPTAVCQLIEESFNIVRGRALEKGLALHTEVVDTVCEIAFRTDPTRLRQVLINLLGNAVKFTNEGDIILSADLMDRGGKPYLQFRVSDSGIGIDAAGRKKLFEPFSQIDSSISRRFGGTGLGLTICKHIVEALGGTIGMRPNRDGGSTFWFEIPVEVAENAHTPAPAETLSATDIALNTVRTLLVEDNAVNSRVAVRFLAKLGQTAVIVENGIEAVEIASRKKFDLILMDIQMPLMDGIEAVRAIRAGNGPNAQTMIIAMTANSSEEDRERCIAAGFDGFESKPVTLDRLRALFERVTLRQVTPQDGPAPWAISDRQAEMIELFGAAQFRELLSAFLGEASDLLRVLETDGASDEHLRDRLLHTLKGAALNLGLDGVAEVATTLRTARPRADDVARLREQFEGLEIPEKAA